MPVIAPANAVTHAATTAPANPDTRFYGAADAPVPVTLDSSGQRGSFSADLPLDSFKPPLTKDAFANLSVQVLLPPNSAKPAPASIIEKNGKPYLHVAVEGAEVSALRNGPITFAVGDPKSLGTVSVPKFTAQAFVPQTLVDQTAPMLVLEMNGRTNAAAYLAGQQRERAGLTDGTSNWFGTRQLENDRAHYATQAQAADALFAPTLASMEAKFDATNDLMKLFTAPPAIRDENEPLRQSLADASNAAGTAAQLQQARALHAGVNDTAGVAKIDAQLAPLLAQAAKLPALHDQVEKLYADTRAQQPYDANLWLANFARVNSLPEAPAFTDQMWNANNAHSQLSQTERDLANLQSADKQSLPGREAQLDLEITAAQAALAAADERVASLRSGANRPQETFAANYTPDLKVI